VGSGNHWILGGIGRRLNGQISNLSGKPTFLSVLLRDGWVAAIDPKRTLARNKKVEGGLLWGLVETFTNLSYK